MRGPMQVRNVAYIIKLQELLSFASMSMIIIIQNTITAIQQNMLQHDAGKQVEKKDHVNNNIFQTV